MCCATGLDGAIWTLSILLQVVRYLCETRKCRIDRHGDTILNEVIVVLLILFSSQQKTPIKKQHIHAHGLDVPIHFPLCYVFPIINMRKRTKFVWPYVLGRGNCIQLVISLFKTSLSIVSYMV